MNAKTRQIKSKGFLFNIVPPGSDEFCVSNLPSIIPPSFGFTYLYGLWRHEFGIELNNSSDKYELFRIETSVEKTGSPKTSVEDLKMYPEIIFLDTKNRQLADYLDGGSGRFEQNIARAITENPALLTELVERPEFKNCVGIVWNAKTNKEFIVLAGTMRVITMLDQKRVLNIECVSSPGAFKVFGPNFGRPDK